MSYAKPPALTSHTASFRVGAGFKPARFTQKKGGFETRPYILHGDSPAVFCTYAAARIKIQFS
jgi:hypothetical protein